jgi:hypothetical protein
VKSSPITAPDPEPLKGVGIQQFGRYGTTTWTRERRGRPRIDLCRARLAAALEGQNGVGRAGAYSPPPHAIIGFRKIGCGQSAVVCHRPSREIVVKIARPSPYFQGELWPEFQVHNRVYHALLRQMGDLPTGGITKIAANGYLPNEVLLVPSSSGIVS